MGDEVARLGVNALIIAGGTAQETIVPQHLDAWWKKFAATVEPFGGECSDEEIQRLTAVAEDHTCNVVIGLGGGKVIDTAKAVAHAAGAAAAIVPTIASTDAPTSAVSVIYTPEGAFSRYLFLPRNPDLVLVDTQVIAEAPARFLVAGMGDALATWFEADACRHAAAPNQCGGLATLTAYHLARLCYDTILEHGIAALAACEQNTVTDALSHVVEANSLLSGLGFECGGLAAPHAIHNGLTKLAGTHDYYHGEKVAIGVLASLFLARRPEDLVDEVYEFCAAVGLPITLADIGIGDASDDDLRLVAETACAEGETIHHEPFAVSPEAVVAAIRRADEAGQSRRDA